MTTYKIQWRSRKIADAEWHDHVSAEKHVFKTTAELEAAEIEGLGFETRVVPTSEEAEQPHA